MEREEHCKQISLGCVGSDCSFWAKLGLPQLTARGLSWSMRLRLQGALQGNCPKRTWVALPGLSCSGSGSLVLHKGTDTIRHTFCAFPRSQQLRWPGAWWAHCPRWAVCSNHLPGPRHLVSWVHGKSTVSGVLCVSSGELISDCDPPGRYQLSRFPGRIG